MSFKTLKKNSKTTAAKLQEALQGEQSGSAQASDDRLWYPELDKAGNGYAVIRFLPAGEGEEIPWVRKWHHGFQRDADKKQGSWYINDCPTTIGKNCPVCEANSELWDTGTNANQNLARNRKRKINYFSNIVVLEDPKNPENEGKVFIFRYGQKIHDKISERIDPESEYENPVNVFDIWNGCNFKLKIRKVEGWTNYDASEFETTSELFEGDEAKQEEAYKTECSLKEFASPTLFKDYDELKEQLNRVLGTSLPKKTRTPVVEKSEDEDDFETVEDVDVDEEENDDVAEEENNDVVVDEGEVGTGVEKSAMDYFQSLADDEDK